MDGKEQGNIIEEMENEISELKEDRDFYKEQYHKKHEEAKGAREEVARIKQDLDGAYSYIRYLVGFARGLAVALPMNERAVEFAKETENALHAAEMARDFPPARKQPKIDPGF